MIPESGKFSQTCAKDDNGAGERHHCRPPVPPRLRGRAGGAFAGAGQGYRRAHQGAAREIRRDRRHPADGDGGADGGGRTQRRPARQIRRLEEERRVAGCPRGRRRPRQGGIRPRWSTPSIRPPSASKASPKSSTRRSATAWRSDEPSCRTCRDRRPHSRQLRAPVDDDDAGRRDRRRARGRSRDRAAVLGADPAAARLHPCRRGRRHRRHGLRLCRAHHDAARGRRAHHRVQDQSAGAGQRRAAARHRPRRARRQEAGHHAWRGVRGRGRRPQAGRAHHGHHDGSRYRHGFARYEPWAPLAPVAHKPLHSRGAAGRDGDTFPGALRS